MLLGELLAVISESANVCVNSANGILATYDGRDAIPTELNDREILRVDVYGNNIIINVKGE